MWKQKVKHTHAYTHTHTHTHTHTFWVAAGKHDYTWPLKVHGAQIAETSKENQEILISK